MNRNRIIASSTIAIALGLTALAPTVASADPVITVPSDSNIEIGSHAWVGGTGCVAPNDAPTYGGVYFRIPSISGYEQWEKGMEVPATAGEFGWLGETDGFPATDMEFTFFCSTEPDLPVSFNPDDPAYLWVSSPYTRTYVEAAPARAAARSTSAKASSNSSVTILAGSGQDEAGFEVDPEALPIVDRIGITGTPASNLKTRVDANAGDVAKTENVFRAFYGRTPTADELSLNVKRFATKSDLTVANSLASKSEFSYRGNWAAAVNSTLATATSDSFTAAHADDNYVVASFYTLAGRIPTASELNEYSAQLANGLPKVQVVENIALKANSASYWNAKALKK